jgi:hypothetical protein
MSKTRPKCLRKAKKARKRQDRRWKRGLREFALMFRHTIQAKMRQESVTKHLIRKDDQ